MRGPKSASISVSLYSCLFVHSDRHRALEAGQVLDRFGIRVHHAVSATVARHLLTQWQFDAVLLDADSAGDALKAILRELEGKGVPSLVTSGDDDEDVQMQWLEQGATDVVSNSLSLQVIAMKLRRLVDTGKRPRRACDEGLEIGPLRLDPRLARASCGNVELTLTFKQYELLYLLASRVGEFVHRATIAQALRQRVDGRAIDMIVSKIRRKLREVPDQRITINTVYGRGYCLTFELDGAVLLSETHCNGLPCRVVG
jgi:two-component system OmpR family response regulator